MSLRYPALVVLGVVTLASTTGQSFAFDRQSWVAHRFGDRVDPAALNPQPLPPRWVLSRILGNRASAVALNPQPLPPRQLR